MEDSFLNEQEQLHCIQQPNSSPTNAAPAAARPSLQALQVLAWREHCLPIPGPAKKAFLNPTRAMSYPATGVAAPQLASWGWERGMGAGRVPCSSALQQCGEGAWELGLTKIYGFATPLHGEHPVVTQSL